MGQSSKTVDCVICEKENTSFRWTDTHGVGICKACGCPYRLYHYENEKRIYTKAPEIMVKPEYLEMVKEYWNETTNMVLPAQFDMPITSYRAASYSGATEDLIKLWNNWWDEKLKIKEKEGADGQPKSEKIHTSGK